MCINLYIHKIDVPSAAKFVIATFGNKFNSKLSSFTKFSLRLTEVVIKFQDWACY